MYDAYATVHAGRINRQAAEYGFAKDFGPLLPTPDKQGLRVVDLGCGQGALVQWLQQSGFPDTLGIDVSAEQVALATGSGVRGIVCGDFRELLSPATMDVIVATDFLEHFDKYEGLELLDDCFDTLRPGGMIILRVPNAVSPFSGNFRHGDLTHESWYTKSSVAQILTAAHFVDIEVRPCEPVIHGVKSLARSIIWKFGSALMRLLLAAETGVARGHIVTQNFVVSAQKPLSGNAPPRDGSDPREATS